jgi:hypothetical protein
MAYPISEPRRIQKKTKSDDLMIQINEFRKHMQARFVAFDPVTIDERPLKLVWDRFVAKKKVAAKKARRAALYKDVVSFLDGSQKLRLSESDLWPETSAAFGELLCGPEDEFWKNVGATARREYVLLADEVRRVVEEKPAWQGSKKGGEVDNQIVRRDFRLIDQADCVVIYRPSMKKPSWPEGGTRSEYKYAKDTGKPAVVIRDAADGAFDKLPFVTAINPYDIVQGENLDGDVGSRMDCLERACAMIEDKIAKSLK